MTEAPTEPSLDDEIAVLLRNADQRYTSGRRKVVAALQAADGPITITQVLEQDRSLAQSSVYRNLTILEEVGVITRIVTDDDFARYELAEHLTHHHHHLICSSCGDVADFSLDSKTEALFEAAFAQAAKAAGFTIDSHRLDLLGACSSCPDQAVDD